MQYPFYHLQSEPFWRLEPLPWCVKNTSYSLRELRRYFYGAIIDSELFDAFRDDTQWTELRRILVETFLQPELLRSEDRISPNKQSPWKIARVIDDGNIAAEPEDLFSDV
ncbi:MAG: hypothetical protein K2K97_07205 [Muribaculaceae bacterium]|nr:hypothetical protein [Muribaculaceae bacterium]